MSNESQDNVGTLIPGEDVNTGGDDASSAEGYDAEYEASQQGWVPRDQYRGPGNEWVDAETFVERGRQINPILRANNKRLMDRLSQQDATNKKLTEAINEFRQYHSNVHKNAYDQAIESLKSQRKQAMIDGETETALNLEDQLDELRATPPAPLAPIQNEAPVQDEALQEWAARNDWFTKDPMKTSLTMAVAEGLNKEQPALKGQDFISEVERRLGEEFPKYFKPVSRQTQERVFTPGTGNAGGSTSGKASILRRKAELPQEARTAMKKFVDAKLLTEEQYIKDYFGD